MYHLVYQAVYRSAVSERATVSPEAASRKVPQENTVAADLSSIPPHPVPSSTASEVRNSTAEAGRLNHHLGAPAPARTFLTQERVRLPVTEEQPCISADACPDR